MAQSEVLACVGGSEYTIVGPLTLALSPSDGAREERPSTRWRSIKAIRAVVHDKRNPREALDLYQTLKNAR